jgi:hypothetical protein
MWRNVHELFSSIFTTKHFCGLLQAFNEFPSNLIEIRQIISASPSPALCPGRSLSTNPIG